MIALDVDARSTQDGATFDVAFIVEENMSGEWRERERVNVTAGTPDAKRTFLLEPAKQRVRMEALETGFVVVYDKEQMSSHRRPVSVAGPVPEETEFSVRRP